MARSGEVDDRTFDAERMSYPLVICYSLLLKMAIEIVDFAKMDKNCDFSSSLCKRVPEGKAN